MERLDKYCYLRTDSFKNETAIVYSKDVLETYEPVWFLVRQLYINSLRDFEVPTNKFINKEGRYKFYKIDSDFFTNTLKYDEGNLVTFISILNTFDRYANEDRFCENT